ncbi:glycosyltransferase family 39 protein [Pseudomonas sp. NFACC39-1]|uniref:glycosyltransferase family 39 protein n=1 Tax=Pseudomonas sp. NFACC39-1 TaxID=1566195 RepID=UPI0008D81133|nr:glycosyltransferase family 39 protein [Pseudomonas sp. NFACC39-1]SEN53691.1 Dolichyl-phosphate-mannose-protein mannosyltransferase [Pseudomonas sp. NFACC39-1]
MKVPRVYLGALPSRLVDRSALAVVAVLALVVRFHGITVPVIWYDEAFSVLLARHEPWQIWSMTARDVHPPLYYLVLHYWMILFGDGVLAVRSLSAIADVGTVLLSIKMMSLVATRRATWIAALLLALLPISIRYSQEARMYTLLGFWLMGATVALVCWIKASERKQFAFIYVLLMTAAFYTHYFAALCVLVHWFYWWWGRPGVSQTLLPVHRWILANAAIVVLFVPWLPHFIDQLSGRQGLEWIPPVTGQAVFSLFWQVVMLNGEWAQWLGLRALPLLMVIAFAAILVWKDNTQHRFNSLLAAYLFIPIVVLAVVALFVPSFVPRYLVFAAAGLPLVIAVALDVLTPRPSVLIFSVAIAVAVEIQGLQVVYRQTEELSGIGLRRVFGLAGLAAMIKQAARPDDQVVLESLKLYVEFSYYNQTGIRPKFYIQSSSKTAQEISYRNGYVLIYEGFSGDYLNNLETLKCHGRRVWWIAPKSDAKPLSEKDWEQTLTLVDGEMAASLFTSKAAPISDEAGNPATATQPPLPAAQACPPSPQVYRSLTTENSGCTEPVRPPASSAAPATPRGRWYPRRPRCAL